MPYATKKAPMPCEALGLNCSVRSSTGAEARPFRINYKCIYSTMRKQYRSDSSPRKRRTVPWWETQLSLFDPEPGEPKRATDDPPSVPDRIPAVPFPDALPKGIRDVYVSVFGLPTLHPENDAGAAPEAAVRRPVDADARCGEVVA